MFINNISIKLGNNSPLKTIFMHLNRLQSVPVRDVDKVRERYSREMGETDHVQRLAL